MNLCDHIHFWSRFIFQKLPINNIQPTAREITRLKNYFKLKKKFDLDQDAIRANEVNILQKTAYAYDWYRMVSPSDSRLCYPLFGDIQFVPEKPSLTKSRPISDNNGNNVLLPLNTSRHLKFITDTTPFKQKVDKGLWRGAAYKTNRKNFLNQASQIPFIEAKDTSRDSEYNIFGKPKSYMNQTEQLKFKFIFCIEGNDVASNLKWVMGSNSVPVMPKPRFETWFNESFLVPGQHYVEVRDDFSDLGDVLEHYLERPKISDEIAQESKRYALDFMDLHRQFELGRLVLEHYFTFAEHYE